MMSDFRGCFAILGGVLCLKALDEEAAMGEPKSEQFEASS